MSGTRKTERNAAATVATPYYPEYTREELLAGAESLFAVKPEVVIGALYGSEKETYSIEETQRFIREFQQRKVQH
ncbi:MAG: hypothetical protein K0Q59_5728 [Paenibacillus sp.]|nr:hypothetical protein [Paenibacillus sp.]